MSDLKMIYIIKGLNNFILNIVLLQIRMWSVCYQADHPRFDITILMIRSIAISRLNLH